MKNKAGYISIKEASRLVGVHPDTIRRLIKQHKGSSNIAQGKGSKSPYYLNTDWLMNIYGLNEPHTSPVTAEKQQDEPPTSSDMNNAMSELIEDLKAKNEQHIEDLKAELKAKNEQIAELQATNRELAVGYKELLENSQKLQGLSLSAKTSEPETADVVTVKPADSTEITDPKKSKKPKKKNTKTKPATKNSKVTASNKQPKKRWWKR